MSPMTIKLQTVTPLWTGGVNGQADRIHTSGIIGSLRWWYEVLIRGLGGAACDPSEHQCLYDPESNIRAVCDACQIFGATGWKRRFRLLIEDSSTAADTTGTQQPTETRYKRGSTTEYPSWYFKGGRKGNVSLSIIPLGPDFDPHLLLGLLRLIERCAALAAKPQLGYGLIQLTDAPLLNVKTFIDSITCRLNQWQNQSQNQQKPSLIEMFFADVTPGRQNQSGAVPTVLNLKYDLRAAFRAGPSGLSDRDLTTLRHFVCGKERPDDKRQASKIAISQFVGGRMRIWGWIPSALPINRGSRQAVINVIHDTLSSFGTVNQWREFNSSFDTQQNYSDAREFLRSLLEEAS